MSKEKFVRDKPHLSIGLVIAFSSIALAIFTGLSIYKQVLLHDGDGDKISDHEELYYRRIVTLDLQPGKIDILSTLNEHSSDTVQIEILYNSKLQIQASYHSNLSLVLQFVRIFEFDDVNSNHEFDQATDVVLQEFLLNDLDLSSISSRIQGQSGFNITLTSSSGVFSANVLIPSEFIPFGDSLLTPWMNKWNFHISLSSVSGGNSLVAVEILLNGSLNLAWTETTFDELAGYVQNETGLEINTANLKAYFSWHNQAIVDGISTPANGDLVGNETLYLLFSKGLEINYDPLVVPKLDDRHYQEMTTEIPWIYPLLISAGVLVATVTYSTLKGKKILQN